MPLTPSSSTTGASESHEIPSTSLQPTTSDAVLESHGNETVLSGSIPSPNKELSPMTPADCRTLKKILEDVHSPSPFASPVMQRQDDSMLSVDLTEDGSSDTGIEDEVPYTEPQYVCGDELEAGYEDEDDSMELSDAGGESPDDAGHADASASDADQSIVTSQEDDSVYVWSDGDTIEDIMNTPGKTAPPARPQHLDGVYLRDIATPDETKEIKQQRATLEMAVVKERVAQELQDALVLEDETSYPDEYAYDEHEDAIDLSDVSKFQAPQQIEGKTGLSMLEEEDAAAELEYFQPNDRRTSRRFSPALLSCHASENSHPTPSIFDAPDSRPAVIVTPSSRHLAFTPNATIPDPPFTPSLASTKHPKGKENSPSKPRRNASLPEEIAALSQEAQELEDLNKYRDLDLAPMSPVMLPENADAGDLMPAKSHIYSARVNPCPPGTVVSDIVPASKAPVQDQTGTSITASETQLRASNPRMFPLGKECEEFVDGDQVEGLEGYAAPPTFVIVLSMVPEAMFWAVVAGVVKVGNRVYGAYGEKFGTREM